MYFRNLMLVIALALVTACSTHTTKTVPTATENPTVIDKSPVSGKELEKAVNQLLLDARLLADCVVPLPAPDPKATSARDVGAIKKAETALYYDCAYRHNALVLFLANRLGIKPDEAVEAPAANKPK